MHARINLKILPAPSIRDRVYGHLRDEIIAGRIAPGTFLVESRLAEQMDISRTPVREALHVLHKEGFVEVMPRVGYRVREIDLKEFEELCEIRKALETLAVRWALKRMPLGALKAMKENLDRQTEMLRRGQWKGFIDLDAEFHDLLGRASRSRRLQLLMQSIRGDMVRYRVKSLFRKETVGLALEGHRAIYTALKRHDEASASSAVLDHLEQSKKYVLIHAFGKGGEGAL